MASGALITGVAVASSAKHLHASSSLSSSSSASSASSSSSGTVVAAAAAASAATGSGASWDIARKAFRAASAGGLSGAVAAATQVTSFMWLTTTISFQHRSGLSAREALRYLYTQGGVRRMYAGLTPTIAYGSLARLGDVGSNTAVLHMLEHRADIPIAVKTALSSAVAAGLRGALVPLEAFKQNLQIRGKEGGLRLLHDRFHNAGVRGLWHGAAASCTSAFVAHFPMFLAVNTMSRAMPVMHDDASRLRKILCNGCIGFTATMVADTANNGFKVVATTQQTNKMIKPSLRVAKDIMKKDGVFGFLVRGLKTRLCSSALQNAFFVVVWKEIERLIPAAQMA